MPLILAIEPDRRQASQLTSVVRRRVSAELILVDTTERALDAIGNRVPDLVLVPALLSPQDDAALAAALRVIATAAHVQMLTTPVLAASRPKAPSGGVLAALRRDRSQSQVAEGCDPAVFADQILSYLEHVTEERAAMAPEDDAENAEQPAAGEVDAEEVPVAEPSSLDLTTAEPPASVATVAKGADLPVLDEFLASLEQMPLPVIEQVVVDDDQWSTSGSDDAADDDDDVDLTGDLEKAIAAAALDEIGEAEVDEDVEQDVAGDVAGDVAQCVVEVVSAPPSMMALAEMAREDEKLWIALSFGSRFTWPVLEGAPIESPAEERKVEWVELIASLRQDVERRRSEGAAPPIKRSTKKQKPVQDEWGFFDPEQCGFAALLAKLEQVTELEEGGRP